jgi:hypothetical protein
MARPRCRSKHRVALSASNPGSSLCPPAGVQRLFLRGEGVEQSAPGTSLTVESSRCDFYTPKNSSKGQLQEAKENLQKMLAAIPLTEKEQAAVQNGQLALDLADVPTPAGPACGALRAQLTATP